VSRPRRLVLVAGTATDIGKTWVGGQVLSLLRASGVSVAARKPAQSADPHDAGPSDAEVLGGSTGEPPDIVCLPHRSYGVAMAPPMAAEALGLDPVWSDDLIAELTWPDPAVDVGWLETVGGPRSPIALDADAESFGHRIEPDTVVLVADPGLGTINSVQLSAEAMQYVGGDDELPFVVYLNRFEPDGPDGDLHRRNLRWLTREGLEIVTDPEALAALLRP
jgi:dethiobiotin synthetase